MAIHHPITPRKNTPYQVRLSAAEKQAEDPAAVAQKMDDETALLYVERIFEDKMTPVSHCWGQACAQYPVLQKMHNLIVSHNDIITTLVAKHATNMNILTEEVLSKQQQGEKLATENKKNKK